MRGSGQDVACLLGTSVSLSYVFIMQTPSGDCSGSGTEKGEPWPRPIPRGARVSGAAPRGSARAGSSHETDADTGGSRRFSAAAAEPTHAHRAHARPSESRWRQGGGQRRSAEVRLLLRRGRRSACPAFPGAGPPAPSLLTFHQVHARFSDEGRLRLPDRTQRRGGFFRRVGSPRPRPGLGPSPPGQCAGYSQASFPCSVFSTDPAVGPQEGWGTGPGNPVSRWLGVQQGAEEAGGACLRLGLLTARPCRRVSGPRAPPSQWVS